MGTEELVTFCRICEPLCGLVATVEDGRLVRLRPNNEHPLSRGFACPKGIAMTDVQNDPDRVLRPLRRRPDGEFEPVGWDEALDDIGGRRTGSCLGRQGTLVAFLLDALNVVTGNLDRAGGAVFGSSPLPFEALADRFRLPSYGRRRSRCPDRCGGSARRWDACRGSARSDSSGSRCASADTRPVARTSTCSRHQTRWTWNDWPAWPTSTASPSVYSQSAG
ncbi:MAG: molybdopterin oxidoreductase [Actinomycetia bacterium]|nr:molybdopterin oxidoreductase [Actinomycetes bacterium]